MIAHGSWWDLIGIVSDAVWRLLVTAGMIILMVDLVGRSRG